MRGITLFGATPNRLSVLYKFLAKEKGMVQNRKILAAIVGPESLARSDNVGEDNAFRDCLAVGKDLGFFSLDGELVRIANPSTAEKISKSFEDELAVRLIDNVQTAFCDEGALAGAIAWMLLQNPLLPLKWTGSSSVTLRLNQFRAGVEEDFGMSNDSAFQQAVYWARTLGFVTRAKFKEEVVVPDPTQAIERRLDKLLPRKEKRLLITFLSDLADCCPVFEGGRVRLEVEEMVRPEFRREPGEISHSTALALQRLRLRQAIKLERLDDAEVLYIEGSLDDGRYTHISRN